MIEISIRSLQHFLYCPHRWGLLEIGKVWAENYFVTKANLLHERVHSGENFSSLGKKVFTAVQVYNDIYGLFGVVDVLEIKGDEVCIVEYKPRAPKNTPYNFDDLMQVFAQKICADFVFDCDAKGVIYYADCKKRVNLPLNENFAEFEAALKSSLQEMRNLLNLGQIPPINKTQKCSGCSLKDLCMPKIKKQKSIKEQICESF